MWIDQSTPPVQETRPRHDPSPLQDYEVGQLIKVTGQISKFKETTQIIFQPGDSVVCDDPNDETMFRLTVMDLEYSVYSKPVVLPESIVREMNKKPMTEETLMDRIREWISTRDEFEYFELEDDEENDRIALEIVRSKATKLMTRCLQQLVYAGSLEVIEGQLAFRVIKDPVTLRKRRSSRENSGDHDVLQLVMAHEISSGEDSDSGWDSDLGEVKLEVKVEELDHEVQVKEEEQEQELEQEEQEEEQKERPTRGKKRKQEEEE
ncbi:hypothetical protein BGX31_003352 [Mortierella sp. GBA43]|nr:hypothetical protein BGX31_003352 [Mortierella sp. GBA43]